MSTTTEAVISQTIDREKLEAGGQERRRKQPAYHVILMDDDDHTYEYVIGMLRTLFGCTTEKAYQLASEVDCSGRVIVDTTTLERAEFKRDQIHSFGRDWRIARCEGSMSAIIQAAPE